MVGIHYRERSFSDRWIGYCQEQQIPYQIVDALSTDLITKAGNLKAFLWHWHHSNFAETLVAHQIIMALGAAGVEVFPNTNTCWHFDDKVGQKYLLEAVKAPLAPTWVFFSLDEAMAWISHTTFPKVFKLRKGAGSSNVRLVSTRAEAERLTKTAFSQGFRPIPTYTNDIRTKVNKLKSRRDLLGKLQRLPSSLHNLFWKRELFPKEREYIYFQEYMPDNDHDIRITVIGKRAFGFIRRNRPGDFKASGSGLIDYDPKLVDMRFVSEAFQISNKIGSQSMAMDFVYDENKNPVVLEISYAYMAEPIFTCPGHWTPTLAWNSGHTRPQDAILQDLLQKANQTSDRTD